MLNSGYNESLFHAACSYIARGWSCISVYGDADPARAKVAAVAWASYQHSHCTAADAYHWCVEKGRGGVAIVTGRISGLAVLDFDDIARFDEFWRDYPDLCETYTVQTRRGVHLYYKVFPSVVVESLKATGVDLQFEGRYVVCPPTIIDGHQYRVTTDVAPKTISEADVRRLYAFLAETTQKNTPKPAFEASTSILDNAQITAGDLTALYRHLAPRMGRNEALFRVCLRARDSDWPLERVMACLADVHAQQPANGAHHAETPERRYREAIGTIESAFSRPARQRRKQTGQLSNSIREALLKQGQTHTLRVLEGLQLRGVQAGQVFTYREAVQLLSGLVGQWSIRRALTAQSPDGTPIFASSPGPPSPSFADTLRATTQSKKLLLIRASKPTQNRRGRPTRRYFTMPDTYELCEKLGARPSGSDTVVEADVRSARQYRQALHQKYIQRRPGQYPRSWLASRVGVSVRTEQRYNMAADIQVQARYDSVLISWSNLNTIPDFEVAGTFLQTEGGKRYPARQEIAAHLLAQRRTVIYRRQRPNVYWCGDSLPADMPSPPAKGSGFVRERGPTMTQHHLQAKIERQKDPIRAHLSEIPFSEVQTQPLTVTAPPPAQVQQPSSTPLPPIKPTFSLSKPERRSKRFFRKPLPDERMERLAAEIHTQTNPGVYGNTDGLSLVNARRLVHTYGVEPVKAGLKRTLWMRERGKVKDITGFLVTVSRMMWRLQHGMTDLGAPAPRFKAEPQRTRNRQHGSC